MSVLRSLFEILRSPADGDGTGVPAAPATPPPADAPAVVLPNKALKLMIVTNKRTYLNTPIAFLKRRGYSVLLVNNMMEALKSVQSYRPRVVMLSWHLPKTNVPKMYQLFSTVMKINTIAYTEDSGVRTSAAIMSSGIPN